MLKEGSPCLVLVEIFLLCGTAPGCNTAERAQLDPQWSARGQAHHRTAHGNLVNVRSNAQGLNVNNWNDNANPNAGIPSLWASF